MKPVLVVGPQGSGKPQIAQRICDERGMRGIQEIELMPERLRVQHVWYTFCEITAAEILELHPDCEVVRV